MKISNFERSLDYEKLLSDGVILEVGIGDTNAKLMFYQKLPKINEKGEISKEETDKTLQLEINLPQETLVRLSYASLGRIKAKKTALRMKGNNNDENKERALFEYDEALGTMYDTDDIELSKEDYYKINEALTNLAVRTNSSSKNEK